jgi:hypothetical protein
VFLFLFLFNPKGIFVKNIVNYIIKEKKAINKSFALYAKDNGGAGGAVMLKLARTRMPALRALR